MADPGAETPEDVVGVLYRVLLGRDPDPEGFAHHVDDLRSNRVSARDLAVAIVSSAEFLAGSAADRMVRVESSGCTYLLPAGAATISELMGPEGYEPWVLPYFLELCRPGMTVLDVGASWGAFALPAARRVGPRGRVYAVEVSASNCRVLLRSARASGIANLEILPFGVSDHLGAELLPRQERTNNNFIETGVQPDPAGLDAYDVAPVLPIDLFRSALGAVQLMKIDIEGMEYRATKGALAFLEERRPIVFCEYSPAFQKLGSGVDGAELLKLFLGLGYEVEILHRTGRREAVVTGSGVIDTVQAAWRRHVEEDHGTHLDLCLHPLGQPRPAG